MIIQSELLSLSVSDWKQFSLIIKIGKRLTLKNYKYQTVLFRSSFMCKLCRCTHKLYINAIRHLLLCTMASTILNGLYRTEKCELPRFVCTMWTVLVIVESKAFIGIYDSQDLCEYCPHLCSILLEFYRWLCAIVKRWWRILEQSFKFAGVLWLLEWSSCEKLCLVGKINQYASEWQQRLFECVIFFKPVT